MNEEKKCEYVSPERESCARQIYKGTHCVHHALLGKLTTSVKTWENAFRKSLTKLISAKDGKWTGFTFPDNFECKDKKLDFAVDVRHATFKRTSIDNVQVMEIDLSKSKFLEEVYVKRSTFKSGVGFRQCNFDKATFFEGTVFEAGVDFNSCQFNGRAVFKSTFRGNVNFNNAIFHESTTFKGWREVYGYINIGIANKSKPRKSFVELSKSVFRFLKSISKKESSKTQEIFYVFESGAQMQSVEFRKPDKTVFSMVDLSKCYMLGTDVKGVKFWNVQWWQPILGRNGLYDDLFIAKSKDKLHRRTYLKPLEQTYRNVRTALEENREYEAASDFYRGEMEANRAQKPFLKRYFFSIAAGYAVLSEYGTNASRAACILLLLIALHFSCSVFINHRDANWDIESLNFPRFLEFVAYSTQVVTFQPIYSKPIDKVNPYQLPLDTLFRILGAGQIALLVFALRAAIKRY